MNSKRCRVLMVATFSLHILFGFYLFNKQDVETVHHPEYRSFQTLRTTTSAVDDRVGAGITEKHENEQLRFNHYVFQSTVVGKEFTFDNETALKVRNILSHQTFKREPVVSIDANTPFFDFVVPVTGASSNHFRESTANIEHFSKHFPGTRVVYYDLGLDDSQVSYIKSLPFVTLRKFDFASYPAHVRNLHNYAWKLLIIQQILAEFDGVMWFDASVKFQGNQTHIIMERLARHKSGFMFYVSTTGHSIVTATHPGMMAYFPMEKAGAIKDMLQGGAVILINTAEVQRYIMKWVVICALKTDCIAPDGSTRRCNYNFPRKTGFGGCHRYDQSLLNILVSKAYSDDEERYHFASDDFAVVNRMRYTPGPSCSKHD